MLEAWVTISTYFTLYTIAGAGVYIYLNLTKKAPEDKADCWRAVLFCGPGAWLYAVFKLHNECMKEKEGE